MDNGILEAVLSLESNICLSLIGDSNPGIMGAHRSMFYLTYLTKSTCYWLIWPLNYDNVFLPK